MAATPSDEERLKRANAAMARGLDGFSRIQGSVDRLRWIVWGALLLVVATIAGCVFLRPGAGS